MEDDQRHGRIFGLLFGTIRSVLGTAERMVRGSAQLARVAFAGALTGTAGMAMAIVMICSGADTASAPWVTDAGTAPS